MASETVYRVPAGQAQELEQLRVLTEQFRQGQIPAARYQAFRVPQGVYEQRESGRFMLRARLVSGILNPEQMRVAADVAETYGDGTLHLTSRQDLQIHGVRLEGIHPALVRLAEAGLFTKGGGGNTVRNIAACPMAGVCAKEAYDVTADVVRLTESLLPDPLSFQLPRKYKISFSGCGDDCSAATVNDLGFIAKQRGGVEGFSVYVAGGMGANSRVGTLLEEFIPRQDSVRVAEAVKRVYDRHGNRKNRHRARLRFLLEDLGFEEFKRLYREQLAQTPDGGIVREAQSTQAPPTRTLSSSCEWTEESRQWRQTNVAPQKQDGFFTVEITRPLGIIQPDQLRSLAGVIEQHGEGVLRATNWQRTVLRWVSEAELPALFEKLSQAGLAAPEPPILRRTVACAGSATCRLGICLSRGLAKAIRSALLDSGLNLHGKAGEVQLHISGCPNACGRHPIAQIGLFGAARRVNGRLAPHYVVQFGGHVEEGGTALASGSTSLPARNVPAYLVELLRAYGESASSDFLSFLQNGGRETAVHLATAYVRVPAFEENPSYYFDWDADAPFTLAGRGPGECGAGVFDLIQVDIASATEALASGKHFEAVALASRALLVTRGEQADTYKDSLRAFERLFVQAGPLPQYSALITSAVQASENPAPETAFANERPGASALLDAVKRLYEEMGPSLRAPSGSCSTSPLVTLNPSANIVVYATHDFRGVVCPLNYVKTKMALAKIQAGQTLSILLDEQGATNVPESAAKDGHEVLSVTHEEDHWKVLVRKTSGSK